ncbi:hypothetical protein KEM55_002411 [Ascosphaera atra]|nr:hypothetical protein KEM55_002411 [Ascosphaera atra]
MFRCQTGSSAPPGTFLTLSNMRLRLVYTATTKKPVCKDCPDCSMRTEDLGRWEFLTEPIHLKPGAHDFPFSYLLPGHLPATTMGSLGTVEYSLRATASTSAGEHLPPLHMPLRISRAVLPGNDKTSVRIFPPTNLTGKVVLPSVVHPIGTFPVQMTLSGVVDSHETTQTRWRLRRLIWRIEEHQKLVSTACHRHTHKLSGEAAIAAGGPSHHETRIVGHGEEKAGWKTDFSTAGGEIYFEFDASLRPGCEPLCDIFPLLKEDGTTPMNPGALEVRHNLVIELIVAEEFVSLAAPGGPGAAKNCTPTGAARVLRMLFHLNVTERSGLGISWDEEMPPVYADVPPSPPTYAHEVEDEAQVGLTGPGVGSSGGRNRQQLPKLPPYARLERMDNSTLTPVQRPADTRPPGHSSRVPVDVSRGMPASMQHLAREDLELLEEDVAGFSLDDQGGPLHQALPHQQTQTVGEDVQVATQAPLRGAGESAASTSVSTSSAS